MTTQLSTSAAVHGSFGDWAFAAGQNGLHPMIYVVGTRGKSTIARLLDTIAREAGLRTALRTDSGVEIEGKRQLGDIRPLMEALDEIDSGELDLAIIEEHVFARHYVLGQPRIFHRDQVFIRGDFLVREPELSSGHQFQCPAEFGVSGAKLGAGEVHKDADGLPGHRGDLAHEVDRNDMAIQGAVACI